LGENCRVVAAPTLVPKTVLRYVRYSLDRDIPGRFPEGR
jgi:hypothetical protein